MASARRVGRFRLRGAKHCLDRRIDLGKQMSVRNHVHLFQKGEPEQAFVRSIPPAWPIQVTGYARCPFLQKIAYSLTSERLMFGASVMKCVNV